MRKILSLFLILSICLSFVPVFSVSASEEEGSYPDAYLLMLDLGIMNEQEENEVFNENMIVTRKEFASAIVKAYGINTSSSFAKLSFKDVSETDPYYTSISAAVSMKLMSGYNSETFGPDDAITGVQAVKVLIHALGYDVLAYYKGGYPTGYPLIAKEIGLTFGLSEFNYNDYITVKSFSRLLVNLLKTHPFEANGIKNEDLVYTHSAKTFGEINMNLQYGAGVVYGNSEIMLTDAPELSEGELYINNTVYNYNRYDDSLIGRYVEYFYSVDPSSEMEIKAIAEKDGKNSEFVLSSELIISTVPGRITYEENGNIKNITVSESAKLVYNGKSIMSCDFSNLVNKETCFITFIDNNNSGYDDVIIIEDYNTLVVENINYLNRIIKDKETSFNASVAGNADGVKKIEASYEKGKEVIVKNKNGDFISFDSINKGNVVSWYENERVIKLLVSTDVAEFKVEYAEEKYLVSSDRQLRLSNRIQSESVKPNSLYTVYTDVFDRVVYMELGATAGFSFGYIVGVKPAANQFTDSYYKFFNEKGEFETLVPDENLFINGTKHNIYNVPDDLCDGNGSFSRQLVRYKKTEEGKLKEIITADRTIGTEGSTFFYGNTVTYDMNKMFASNYSYVTWRGIVNADSSTLIFKVPSDKTSTNEEEFDIVPMSRMKMLNYTVESYHTDMSSQVADALVIYTDVDIVNHDSNAGVVIKNSKVINDEGMSVYSITLLVNNQEVKVNTELSVSAAAAKLDKGDVIRYEVNGKGEISSIKHIYDSSAQTKYLLPENPTWPQYFVTSSKEGYGKIASVSDGFIRVAYDFDKVYTPNEIYGLESYSLSRLNVTVIKEVNGNVIVSQGSVADIDVGDYFVIITRSESVKLFALIKR